MGVMAIYLLTKVQEPLNEGQKLSIEEGLTRVVPDRWREVGNGSYLAFTDKPLTIQDFSLSLGLATGSCGAYLVTEVDSYYGWASRAIWDWIKTMRDQK